MVDVTEAASGLEEDRCSALTSAHRRPGTVANGRTAADAAFAPVNAKQRDHL